MYQALYRKYRPQTFDDVVGQTAVTQTLRTQLKTGKISHAYLFTGTRGTGKTSCAKILAKALNCTDLQDGSPCGHCAACRAIDSGSCLDVLEIDAASNNGVDQVRVLRDDAVYTPSEVSRRVYIIDEVHMLSMAAFNALLKIIEEPPEHLVFILATTELQKVPATILSRCQRFSFRRLLPEDIAGRLNYIAYQEHIDLDPGACRLLSRLADGALARRREPPRPMRLGLRGHPHRGAGLRRLWGSPGSRTRRRSSPPWPTTTPGAPWSSSPASTLRARTCRPCWKSY